MGRELDTDIAIYCVDIINSNVCDDLLQLDDKSIAWVLSRCANEFDAMSYEYLCDWEHKRILLDNRLSDLDKLHLFRCLVSIRDVPDVPMRDGDIEHYLEDFKNFQSSIVYEFGSVKDLQKR